MDRMIHHGKKKLVNNIYEMISREKEKLWENIYKNLTKKKTNHLKCVFFFDLWNVWIYLLCVVERNKETLTRILYVMKVGCRSFSFNYEIKITSAECFVDKSKRTVLGRANDWKKLFFLVSKSTKFRFLFFSFYFW